MRRSLITIDPGEKGGIAWYDREAIRLFDMPRTISDTHDLLKALVAQSLNTPLMVLEDVGYHVQGNNAQHSATFARHVGRLEALCVVLNLRIIYINPGIWMRHLCQNKVPKGKTERKTRIFNIVKERYSGAKLTRKTSDALGMLYYTQETNQDGVPHALSAWVPPSLQETEEDEH